MERLDRRRWSAALVLAAALGAGCARKEHVIIMHAMTYEPEVATVEAGDLIVWRNDDTNPHTAVAAGRFDSGQVAPQGTFRVTLTKPGELPYVCTLHPQMKGKIIVK
jgi:plastocyanin